MQASERRSEVVVPHRPSWHRRVIASIIVSFLWLCLKTWRGKWKETPDKPNFNSPVIFCAWHDHLILTLAAYDKLAIERWKIKGMGTLVSASKDGALLAWILGKFGIASVRGSTSRRGPQALLEATRWLKQGYCIAITPDGPRGPARKIQPGVIALAQVTGCPIVPLSNYTGWKIRLPSWDRFQVPLPFARCEYHEADPIWVPREATDAEREQLRLKLEESMRTITVD